MVLDDDYTFTNITIGQYNNKSSVNAKFENPTGVVTNSTGHIFVADRKNDRIQIFDSDGTFVGMFNESSSGKPIWLDRVNDMPNFIEPVDVAISHDEQLIYVTDGGVGGAHAIYYFDATTLQYVGKFGNRVPVGEIVELGDTGANRREIPGRFSTTTGIDVGAGGLLAVAESGRTIVNVFDPAANETAFVVGELNGPVESGTGVPGSEEGQFGLTRNSEGRVTESGPRDVAFSNDGRLLAASDPVNKRFQVFQLDTTSDGRATGPVPPRRQAGIRICRPVIVCSVRSGIRL